MKWRVVDCVDAGDSPAAAAAKDKTRASRPRPHKISALLLAMLALSASAAQAPAPQQPSAPLPAISAIPPMQPPAPGYKFPDNETYVYAVEWRLWNAGNATMRMEPMANGERRIVGAGDSIGAVALLYHVHDHFEAFLDSRTFCSTHISKHIEEGLRRVESITRFDYARGKAVLNQTNLKSKDTKQVEHDIPGCVSDVLSAVYYGGSLPLAAGASYQFPINDGGDTVNVDLQVEAREEIKTPAGTFRTVRVQPHAVEGLLKKKGQIWIWYTDDASHMPVQMRARLFWGTLTFRLVRVEK